MHGPVRRGLAALPLAAVAVLVLAVIPALAQSPSPSSSPPSAPEAGASPGPSAVPLLGPPPSPPVGTPWVRTFEPGGGLLFDQVVAWKGGFVARAEILVMRPPGVTRQMIWTSPDGLAWTEVPDAFGSIRYPKIAVQGLVPFGDVLIAVGSEGRRLVVWTSRDARHWTRVPDAPVFSSDGVPSGKGYQLGITGAAATQDRIEIVGTYQLMSGPIHTRIWTSSDGRDWQRGAWTGADPTHLVDFAAAPDRFTAIIAERSAATGDWVRSVASSPDGHDWTVLGPAPTSRAARLAWSPAHASYLVAGWPDPFTVDDVAPETLWSSPDGAAWTVRIQGPANVSDSALLVDGPTVLISGASTTEPTLGDPWRWTMTSTDLSTWELSGGWPDMLPGCTGMRSFAMAAGRTVAVGECEGAPGLGRAAAWAQGVTADEVAVAQRWGPMAVVKDDSTGGMDAGVGPATLVITDRCVYLKSERGIGSTLVFRSGQTRWDAKHRQIVYRDRDLGEIRLSNGERVILGGYGIGTAARPENVEVGLGPWIKEPDPTCPDQRWVAQQVVPQGR